MRLLFERGTFAALEMVRRLTVAVSLHARSTRVKFPHLVYTIEIPKKSEYTHSYNCYDIYKQQTRHRVVIYFLDNICYSV